MVLEKKIQEAITSEFKKRYVKFSKAPLVLSHNVPPDLKVVIKGKVAYFDVGPRGQYLEQCFDKSGRRK
jgi:hypothetical protein